MTTQAATTTTPTDDTQAATAARKRSAVDAPRGANVYMFSPSDPRLKIVGLDIRAGQKTPDGPDHYLYDTRAFRDIPAERLQNYRYYGVRKPIILVKDGEDLLIDDGRGRLKGARLVEAQQILEGIPEDQRIKIPGILAKGSTEDLFGLSRALNIHDESSVVDNAHAAERLLAMNGNNYAKAAISFGVSEQTVRNWIKLITEASPEILAQVRTGEVTSTVATIVADLPKEEQVAAIAELKQEGGKITSARAKEKTAEKAGKPTGLTPKAKLDKIETLMVKLAKEGPASVKKEDLIAYLDKVAKIVTKQNLAQLGAADDEE